MKDKNPVFKSIVLLVEDIENSKYFYNVVLGQKIVMDFGENVGFEGGLAIWKKDYALNLIFRNGASEVKVGSNNLELYFEFDNLIDLFEKINGRARIIHPIREHPWGQRGFRVYDPDGHIVEFGESMESVVLRLHYQGLNVDEISKKSLMPVAFIQMVLKK